MTLGLPPPPHPPHPPHPPMPPPPGQFFPQPFYSYGYAPAYYVEPLIVSARTTSSDSNKIDRSGAALQYVHGAYCIGYYKAISNKSEQTRCQGLVDGLQAVLSKTNAPLNKMYDFGFKLDTDDGMAKRPMKNQDAVKSAIDAGSAGLSGMGSWAAIQKAAEAAKKAYEAKKAAEAKARAAAAAAAAQLAAQQAKKPVIVVPISPTPTPQPPPPIPQASSEVDVYCGDEVAASSIANIFRLMKIPFSQREIKTEQVNIPNVTTKIIVLSVLQACFGLARGAVNMYQGISGSEMEVIAKDAIVNYFGGSVNPLTINKGSTMIATPSGVGSPMADAEALLQQMNSQGGNCSVLYRWLNGDWNGHVAGRTSDNFALQPNSVYFVRSNSQFTWTPKW
jgi:hypothetical protein